MRNTNTRNTTHNFYLKKNHIPSKPPSLSLSTTQRLHGDHVLNARDRKLDDPQDGLAHSFERLDADGERNEEDVEPGDEEGDRPRQEPEDEEPQDTPENPWTQSSPALALTCTLADSFSQTHGALL
eukprot:GHVL01022529.1.p1 GENE.GHVL01022529.1~~GHVL01022529.1.p1  ORF type:complete len:126 (-),score=15.18 GHVL01022529.1:186-563(-)